LPARSRSTLEALDHLVVESLRGCSRKLGSGEGHSIEEWLERCFELAGLNWRDHVDLVPGFAVEYARLISRPERLRALGWSPTVSFAALAEMLMHST
jgi:hypothetical protein